MLTALQEALCLGADVGVQLPGLLQVLLDVDVGGEADHVLLPTAIGHGQEAVQVLQSIAHDVACPGETWGAPSLAVGPCHQHPVSTSSSALGSSTSCRAWAMELCALSALGGPLSPACPLPITVMWARWEPSKMFAGTSRETSSVSVGMKGNGSGHAKLLLAQPHGTLAHPLPAPTLHELKAGLGHLSQEHLWTLVLGSSGLVALATSGQASLPHGPTALPDPSSWSYLPGRAESCVPSPPGSPQAVGKKQHQESVGRDSLWPPGSCLQPRLRAGCCPAPGPPAALPRAAWTLSPSPSHFHPP